MKVVTFNIRLATPGDGANRFDCRAKLILDKIKAEKPDVIGFQECLPVQFDFLREYLHDYMIVGSGRGPDYEGEHNPIAFNKDRFELMALETQWLSPLSLIHI